RHRAPHRPAAGGHPAPPRTGHPGHPSRHRARSGQHRGRRRSGPAAGPVRPAPHRPGRRQRRLHGDATGRWQPAAPGRPAPGRRAAAGQRPAAGAGHLRRSGRRTPTQSPGEDRFPSRRPGPQHHPRERHASMSPRNTHRRRSGLVLLAAAALAVLVVPALPASAAGEAPAMRMQNVELPAFIQDVARATGTTFIVDPRVQGTVDISRDQAMSDEDLLGVLMTVLRANGLIAVPAGRATYRVVPDDSAAQQPGSPLGFATTVVPLQRIDARAAAETLKPLVGRGGVVVALPHVNQLLLADYVDNLRRIRGLVSQIDTDTASIDTVSLRNTSARELAATLTELYGGGEARSGAPLTVMPVESSNSLVLRGNPGLVQRAARTAMDLDARAERSGDVAVIRLKHASAEQLLPVLQQLIGQ